MGLGVHIKRAHSTCSFNMMIIIIPLYYIDFQYLTCIKCEIAPTTNYYVVYAFPLHM